jgi:hypothetical protein
MLASENKKEIQKRNLNDLSKCRLGIFMSGVCNDKLPNFIKGVSLWGQMDSLC